MQRIQYIDTLKGVAIILVIMGHLMDKSFCNGNQFISTFIYSFHMPLFMFLSGMFAYKHQEQLQLGGFKTFLYAKVQRIVLPFVMIGGCFSAMYYGSIMQFFSVSGHSGYWYLPALFYGQIIGFFIYLATKRFNGSRYSLLIDGVSIIAVWVVINILYLKTSIGDYLPFYLAFAKMFLYFMLGSMMIKHEILHRIMRSNLSFTASLAMYAVLMIYKEQTSNVININLTGFPAIVILIQMFENVKFEQKSILTTFGVNSLEIYVFHYFLLPNFLGLDILTSMVKPNATYLLTSGNFIVYMTVTALISIVIAYACIAISKVIKHSHVLALLCFGIKK